MRKIFIVLALLIATSLMSFAAKPNVILIVADDLGWADLGCYGSKYHRTPNLDRLAKEGVRFTQFYAACPVCSPTRASIMTGKYPARLKITDWIPGRNDRPDQMLTGPKILNELPHAETTLAELLKSAGYRTGHIGKWHLGGEGFSPTDHGFDVNIAGDHTGTPLSYFAPFESSAKGPKRTMPGLADAPPGQYLTDRLGDEAVKYITTNKDHSFFLYLPHYAPHTPMRAKQDVIAKYPGSLKYGVQSNPIYAAMLESLDDAVGRVLKALDDHGIRKNTIVIFTSDNGGLATIEGPNTPATINTPLREGKGYLYEGGIRVPCIVSGPGVKSGTVTSAVAASQDFVPTLCELCGVTAPKVDGVSLVETLANDTPPKREALYWHYPHYANQGGKPGGAIREGNYKLIEFYESGRRELFDLVKDFRENRNLADEQPDVVKRLEEKLATWRRSVDAAMPAPNRKYVANPQEKSGEIVLPAKTAIVHGAMLRFEPLPHKNCLGFWVNANDWCEWTFTITQPGTFTIEVFQGCGTGQGGSEVAVAVGDQSHTFTVKETGGFQAFEARSVGSVKLDKVGTHTLTVKPKTKAKAAVMDIQKLVLKPQR